MKKFLVVSLSLAFLFGCGTKVTRMETNEIVDLSGDWNDADSQITSQAMINECVGSYWREDFVRVNGRQPVVIVGTVLNRAQEHINTQTITKDLETALVNSGRVRFVASRSERDELRSERDDQSTYSREETRSAKFKETGADFMLKGQINTIFDQEGKQAIKFYQIELELINIETNEKSWIGQKKIKKLVKRSKNKF